MRKHFKIENLQAQFTYMLQLMQEKSLINVIIEIISMPTLANLQNPEIFP